MKTMTAFAAILAAGMALAASAATIGFAGGFGSIGYGNGQLGGSLSIDFVTGLDTPRNEGESTICDQYPAVCGLGFGTDAAYIGGGTYEGKGDAYLIISDDVTNTTLLRGILVQPVTANVDNFSSSVGGALKDVVISEDLAAYYGVPNRGTGDFSIAGGSHYWDPDFPEEGFFRGYIPRVV